MHYTKVRSLATQFASVCAAAQSGRSASTGSTVIVRRAGISWPQRQRFSLTTKPAGMLPFYPGTNRRGASFEDVADILGNSPEIVRKHYAKWSPARQARIDELMEKVHAGSDWTAPEKPARIQ